MTEEGEQSIFQVLRLLRDFEDDDKDEGDQQPLLPVLVHHCVMSCCCDLSMQVALVFRQFCDLPAPVLGPLHQLSG